ncbi:MAG: hypothetical protein EA359_00990 [Balneolaceae bacterium]|nr:MAG: hypothetical protein EA359_00990 [Balneolaceae bacterium]
MRGPDMLVVDPVRVWAQLPQNGVVVVTPFLISMVQHILYGYQMTNVVVREPGTPTDQIG